jgi:hypothetical protein
MAYLPDLVHPAIPKPETEAAYRGIVTGLRRSVSGEWEPFRILTLSQSHGGYALDAAGQVAARFATPDYKNVLFGVVLATTVTTYTEV